jgi:hypothetical protein
MEAGILARMDSSNNLTMGWRWGIWRWVQSSMSEWLADGSGRLSPCVSLDCLRHHVSSSDERLRLMTKM